MENASKALIIAGAILLAILIIGLGMLVFNQARDTVSQANLDQETIAAFNSKFDAYIGDKIKGTQVRTLCDLVRNNNLAADEVNSYGIKLIIMGTTVDKGAANASKINTEKNKISKGGVYKVEAHYSDTTKLIDEIKVSQ